MITRQKARRVLLVRFGTDGLLQPDLGGGVVPEQGAAADVTASGDQGPVARLVHDGPLTDAGFGGSGGQPGPERMRGVGAGVDAGAPDCPLDDAVGPGGGEAPTVDPAVPV